VRHSPVKISSNEEIDKSRVFAGDGNQENIADHGVSSEENISGSGTSGPEEVHGESFQESVNRSGAPATEVVQEGLSSNFSIEESVVTRKMDRSKKSLHPSFVLLEKTPIKVPPCQVKLREGLVASGNCHLNQNEIHNVDAEFSGSSIVQTVSHGGNSPALLSSSLHLNLDASQITNEEQVDLQKSCDNLDKDSIYEGISSRKSNKSSGGSIENGIPKKTSGSSCKASRKSKKLSKVLDVQVSQKDVDRRSSDSEEVSSKQISGTSSIGGNLSRNPEESVEKSKQAMVSDEEPETVSVVPSVYTDGEVATIHVSCDNEEPPSGKDVPSAVTPATQTKSRLSSSRVSSKVHTEVVETSGRPRRGAAAKVSYTEPPLGKKLRQDDGACVYTEGSNTKRKSSTTNTKSRKSVKKK